MTLRAQPGDVYLLCSDGLTTMLSDGDLKAVLGREADLQRTARWLVKAANDRGGRDNITVVLFRLEGAEEAAEPGTEEATLIGAAAEEEGFTADAVRAERGAPPRLPPTRARRRRRAAAAGPAGWRRASRRCS